MPFSFRLTFASGTSEVPEKVSARIRQQTEPLTHREHVMCLRVQTKPDRGTLRNPPLCWDFLVSKLNSGRARRYCDAAASARRIGKTGGIALVTRPRGLKGSLDSPPEVGRATASRRRRWGFDTRCGEVRCALRARRARPAAHRQKQVEKR